MSQYCVTLDCLTTRTNASTFSYVYYSVLNKKVRLESTPMISLREDWSDSNSLLVEYKKEQSREIPLPKGVGILQLVIFLVVANDDDDSLGMTLAETGLEAMRQYKDLLGENGFVVQEFEYRSYSEPADSEYASALKSQLVDEIP